MTRAIGSRLPKHRCRYEGWTALGSWCPSTTPDGVEPVRGEQVEGGHVLWDVFWQEDACCEALGKLCQLLTADFGRRQYSRKLDPSLHWQNTDGRDQDAAYSEAVEEAFDHLLTSIDKPLPFVVAPEYCDYQCHWTITKYHGHPSIYFFWYTYSIVSYHILLTDIIIVIRFDIWILWFWYYQLFRLYHFPLPNFS